MTQLKKTIQKTTYEEVEVKLPHFTKMGSQFFAVVSEKEVWSVNTYSFHTGIERVDLSHSNALNYEQSTKEEFLEAYKHALQRILTLSVEPPLLKEEKEVA